MDIYRPYFYYRSKKDDAPIEEAIRKAAEFGDGDTGKIISANSIAKYMRSQGENIISTAWTGFLYHSRR